MAQYPSSNDNQTEYLKKIVVNTADMSSGTSTVVVSGNVVASGPSAAGSPSSTAVVDVQGHGYQGTATATRGANTTPYAAGDVVGGPLTFINVGPNSGDVLLLSLRMVLNITAIPSGMTSFTLHLYNATPPSAIADNSPWTFGSGDRSSYILHIDNLTPTLLGTGTSTPQAQISSIIEQVRLVGGTSLYAYLVTNGGYTPAANSETYDLKLRGILP